MIEPSVETKIDEYHKGYCHHWFNGVCDCGLERAISQYKDNLVEDIEKRLKKQTDNGKTFTGYPRYINVDDVIAIIKGGKEK